MTDAPPGLSSLLRDFPAVVVTVDAEGVVTESNGHLESALGVDPVGRPFADLLDLDSSHPKWERMRAVMRGAPGARWELVFRGRETLMEPLAFTVLPNPDTGGLHLIGHPDDPRLVDLRREVTGINSELVTIQRALSKEKRALQRALVELERRGQELTGRNRELDQFAHVVSHDLKAPLRSIRNYAEWIRSDVGDSLEGEAADYLERLLKRADDMGRMIDGILRVARAGRGEERTEPVDVAAMVREVIELLPLDGAQIRVPPDLPSVRTDRVQLEQVFLNLLGNAVRYGRTEEQPARVEVSGVRSGRYVAFTVADAGPGVPEQLQERIWDLFYTSGGGKGGGWGGGSGIGLPLVRKLVERNGGSISLDSAPGEGARFTFLWPKSPPADDPKRVEGTG